VAASVFAEPAALNKLGESAAKLAAGLSAPDAGVRVMLEGDGTVSNPVSPTPAPIEEPAEEPEPTPEPLPDPTDIAAAMALVPESRRGMIETTRFASRLTGKLYFDYGKACIWNLVDVPNSDLSQAAAEPLPFGIELNSKQPQVLIMHTHSTESYDRFDAGFYDSEYPSRSTEITQNVNEVGRVMVETLNALGINTVQATDYHDYPSYNNSYSRSKVTVERELAKYPSIKVVIDVHRDGIERENGTRVKPTTVINGKKAAQIMFVVGAGDSENDVPDFRKNLSFAAKFNDKIETLYPTLSRPLKVDDLYYNQSLTTGSVLVEIGGHANTLDEAKYSGELVARALAALFGAA
jgi:stage II sporulation protein P